MEAALKVLTSIGIRLLSEKVIEQLILFALKKLSEMSKTNIDDDLYKIVEEALNKPD